MIPAHLPGTGHTPLSVLQETRIKNAG